MSIDKFSRKNLSKLVTRFIRAYQIDPEVCPSIISDRYYKNLKYLVYRRYVENSINYDPWLVVSFFCQTVFEKPEQSSFDGQQARTGF